MNTGIIKVQKMNKNDQQTDIFTKPLTLDKHSKLRKQFMGWCSILVTITEDPTHYSNKRFLISGW